MSKEFISESFLSLSATALTAGGIAAAVGYNQKAGKSEDELMPHLGPVPADLGVAGAGVLGALAANSMMKGSNGRMVATALMGVAAGGAAVFAMSVGQGAGESLYDSMNGAGGVIAPSVKRREFRDAHGRFRSDEWSDEGAVNARRVA